jgi:hypothetical protein
VDASESQVKISPAEKDSWSSNRSSYYAFFRKIKEQKIELSKKRKYSNMVLFKGNRYNSSKISRKKI